MSILKMSIQAGVLIIAIVLIRAIALNKLPKKAFLVLWGAVLIRLLVPLDISSQFSVYTFVDRAFGRASASGAFPVHGATPSLSLPTLGATETATTRTHEISGQAVFQEPLLLVWFIGVLAVFLFFAVVYWKNRKALQFAVLVRDINVINEWLAGNKLLRPITVLQLDTLTTPITAGCISPRIILPKSMDLSDEQILRYVLTHEYYHIRRFDAFWKLLIILALCLHWFNPMVWVMFVLINRDLEITCDEMVIRHYGADAKTAYAYSLISMAEQRSKFAPLYSGFSKNAAEERIRAIMKYRKTSIIGIFAALLLVAALITGFTTTATNAASKEDDNKTGLSLDAAGSTTDLEYSKLLELRFDNYEDMTVEEYRNKAYNIIGQNEQMWSTLLGEAAKDESLTVKGKDNSDAYFIQSILVPTLAEKWTEYSFKGVVMDSGAKVEYSGTYHITNANLVTMGERNKGISEINEALLSALKGKTTVHLGDDSKMTNELALAVQSWQTTYSNDFFIVSCDTQYSVSADINAKGTYIWPSSDSNSVTAFFGLKQHPFLQDVYKDHTGIDIGAGYATEVLAAADGIVSTSAYDSERGNYIILDHDDGNKTLYAHMSQRDAGAGQRVRQGQSIGLVGSTGLSTGPHLHFEVYIGDTRVDPLLYFSADTAER